MFNLNFKMKFPRFRANNIVAQAELNYDIQTFYNLITETSH
jgi:hypothetical protein